MMHLPAAPVPINVEKGRGTVIVTLAALDFCHVDQTIASVNFILVLIAAIILTQVHYKFQISIYIISLLYLCNKSK